MMRKLFTALVMAMFMVILCPLSHAEEVTGEDALYILDDFQHLPREFEALTDSIQESKPQYARGDIASIIAVSYYTLRANDVKLTPYEVAEGIERFTDDDLGIDFKDLVWAYILSQTP